MERTSHFSRLKYALACLYGTYLVAGMPFSAQADDPVYVDSLQNGWSSWSWDATIDFSSSAPVHGGTKSVAITLTGPWAALYLHHDALDSSVYTNLTFWIHGGSAGGQQLVLQAELSGAPQTAVRLPTLTKAWQKVTVSLSQLGVAQKPDLDGFWIQDVTGKAQATFYLDEITFVTGATPSGPASAIIIDAASNRHPINPLIYGLAFATTAQLSDLNVPINRSGGNSETRYNWQLNAHNHAADWYFESLADSPATPGAAGDDFVATSKNAGAEPMLTIPMIGWLPKLGPNRGRLSSYSISKYGLQTGSDSQWFPDAGNGISKSNNSPITGNDPNDANVLTDSSFQQAYVLHLTNRWGTSANGGVRYYFMDNEQTLWQSTHRDVHPNGPSMQEIRDKFFDYAGMVKRIDPAALALAPEEWGWSGYFYSGQDQQWSGERSDWNPAHFPDRTANGGWDYIPWLLDQFHQQATQTGKRLLDYCTVHIYPQAGEFGNDTSSAMQLRRNRSTRALWDPAYVDQSWIAATVKLIPRLRDWVDTYYPGTKIGITEYNWGAEGHINGATAQADILGIFGRENLDLATRWTTPATGTPTYNAIKLFRNYDGKRSAFGDVSVSAAGMNPDTLASFAALRTSDGALTLIVINKQLSASAEVGLQLTNFSATGTAQLWQLTSANTILRPNDISFSGNSFTNVFPAQSITLMVFPGWQSVVNPPPTTGFMSTNGQFTLRFLTQKNLMYTVEKADAIAPPNWLVFSNNIAGSGDWIQMSDLAPTTQKARFYRVKAR